MFVIYNIYLIFFTKFYFLFFITFFSFYFFFIIFIFLKKTLYLSKITSNVLRFWKLSYYLFWGLEFGLFIIYLYLFLNSTFEVWPMLYNNPFVLCSYNFNDIFTSLCIWLLLFFFLNIFTINNIYHVSNFFIFLFLAINLVYFFLNEIFSFLYINTYFNLYVYNYDAIDDVWVLESDMFLTQPFYFYFYIFSLLKLWHLIFIFYYFFINLGFINDTLYKDYNSISLCSFSFLRQNFYFLFIFYVFNILIIFKSYFLSLFQIIYIEMYVNLTQFFLLALNILLDVNYVL